MRQQRQRADPVSILGGGPALASGPIGPRDVLEDAVALDLSHLVRLADRLLGQPRGAAAQVARLVAEMTQERARLVLHPESHMSHGPDTGACAVLPVRFGGRVYGAIYVLPATQAPAVPAMSLDLARQLAQTCGLVIHLLEHEAFLDGLMRHLSAEPIAALTHREQEVLAAMADGQNDHDIAERLAITLATVNKHQQHIYEKLRVHFSLEAVLVAHRAGLTCLSAAEERPPPYTSER